MTASLIASEPPSLWAGTPGGDVHAQPVTQPVTQTQTQPFTQLLAQPLRPLLNQPLIGFGQVRHTRLRPQRNAFAYRTYFLMLPLRSMATHRRVGAVGDVGGHGGGEGASEGAGGAGGATALAINRPAALSFYDCDHGDGRSSGSGAGAGGEDGALGWLDELLQREGILDATGEVWLHCYPRVLGYTFKPVSFWYCHTAQGALRAIVVEVNNTFGERHCYLLDRPRYGQELRADKVFHVSPFCPVEGGYRFRFMLSLDPAHAPHGAHTVARIDFDDADGPLIQTSVSGALVPATRQAIRTALWRYPAMTFGVIARIHWQAERLWLKRTRFFSKPVPPDAVVTRQL